MAKSILDLDEARRRLEQIEADHHDFGTLIAKLRSLRDGLTATLEATESRLAEASAELQHLKSTTATFESQLATARQDYEGIIDQLNESTNGSEKRVHSFIHNAKTSFDDLRGTLTKDIERWRLAQEGEFEVFREQHHTTLDRVAKAYERLKVNTDSLIPATDTLRSDTDQLSATVSQLTADVSRVFHVLGRHKDDADARLAVAQQDTAQLVEALQAQVQGQLTQCQNDSTSLRNQLALIEKAASDRSSHQQNELTVLRKRVRRLRISTWLFTIGGTVCLLLLSCATGVRWSAIWHRLSELLSLGA